MRDLPGYYFDTVRQRYFPESSRPKSETAAPATPATPAQPLCIPAPRHQKHQNQAAHRNFNASIVQVQRSGSQMMRDRARHSVMSQQIASTSSSLRIHVPIVYDAPISSICISQAQEQEQTRNTISLGDRSGFCYADTSDAVFAEHHLFSEITSIQASGDVVVYTSFGPAPRILIRSVSSQEACILRPSYLHDVRDSHIQDRSLTIGMLNKAIHIFDLDHPRITRSLMTFGDVFALHRHNHDIWTGARNGVVRLFDVRTCQDQNVLGCWSKQASVTHLRRIREYQLLAAATDSSLKIFDVRFLRRSTVHSATVLPVQSFEGHVNNCSRLGLAVDTSEEFLFAAGDDKLIRAWSLRTGQRLQPTSFEPDWNGLLTRKFPLPPCAMQVTSDGHTDTLWVASSTELECFQLGKRRTPDI